LVAALSLIWRTQASDFYRTLGRFKRLLITMMKYVYHLLLILGCLLAAASASGQSGPGLRPPVVVAPKAVRAPLVRLSPASLRSSPAPELRAALMSVPGAPLAWRYEELAFFCRLEVQLEKAARIPVRFRLGDVRYVDYLEGKRDAYE
jgi:hypothetical protein